MKKIVIITLIMLINFFSFSLSMEESNNNDDQIAKNINYLKNNINYMIKHKDLIIAKIELFSKISREEATQIYNERLQQKQQLSDLLPQIPSEINSNQYLKCDRDKVKDIKHSIIIEISNIKEAIEEEDEDPYNVLRPLYILKSDLEKLKSYRTKYEEYKESQLTKSSVRLKEKSASKAAKFKKKQKAQASRHRSNRLFSHSSRESNLRDQQDFMFDNREDIIAQISQDEGISIAEATEEFNSRLRRISDQIQFNY